MTIGVDALLRSGADAVSYKRNFRVNFTAIRKRLGLTQKEVAAAIHVTPKTISRWMDEDAAAPDPGLKQIEKLCLLFNCDYGDLLSTPPEVEDAPPKGPVTMVLSGEPAQIAQALTEIQTRWSKD